MAMSADTDPEQYERPAARAPMQPEPQDEPQPEPPDEPLDEPLDEPSNAVTAADHPDLPLWPGNDLPDGRWERRGDILYEPSDGNAIWRLKHSPAAGGATLPPIDWEEDLKRAQRAWKDHVPEAHGRSDDMWAVVVEDLEAIDQAAPVLNPLPTGEAPAPQPAGGSDASPAAASARVNGALKDAAASEGAVLLRDMPEWQRIQSVRGAAGHLMNTIRGKAGEYWEELRTDVRFQGFWKSLSIGTCEAISRLAEAGADRIRRTTAGDLPSADALLKLSDSALIYSTVAARTLLPYGSREEAVGGARTVAESFQAWIALRWDGRWPRPAIRGSKRFATPGGNCHRPPSPTDPAGPLPRTAEPPRRPGRWWRPRLSPPASRVRTLPRCGR